MGAAKVVVVVVGACGVGRRGQLEGLERLGRGAGAAGGEERRRAWGIGEGVRR